MASSLSCVLCVGGVEKEGTSAAAKAWTSLCLSWARARGNVAAAARNHRTTTQALTQLL